MQNLVVAAAQFENENGNKEKNLSHIRVLTQKAAGMGAEVVSFHEGSITGYTFVRKFSKSELLQLAEHVPGGESIETAIKIAKEFNVHLLAGLIEKDEDNKIYNTYVCVNRDGMIAKFRKLHPFLNPHISPGEEYVVFDIKGWKCGILICYDNNLPENVRITSLMGAHIIFMPHITCCLPGPAPGLGYVDKKLWDNRHHDPVSLRREFQGPTAREWLLKWLPCRAYENGVYAIFTNPIGVDDDQIRNGNAMIIDPHGDIVAECNTFGNDVVIGTCFPELIDRSLGKKFIKARRPDLYDPLVAPADTPPETKVSWMS